MPPRYCAARAAGAKFTRQAAASLYGRTLRLQHHANGDATPLFGNDLEVIVAGESKDRLPVEDATGPIEGCPWRKRRKTPADHPVRLIARRTG